MEAVLRWRVDRQLCNILIIWIFLLSALDLRDVSPRFVKTIRAPGQIVFDSTVQLTQAIARYGGIHMVLDVVVHMVVKEARQRAEDDGARTQAEIRYIIL